VFIIKISNLLLLGLSLVFVNGCVTQQYVMGSDNKAKERYMDKREAAMARLKLALEYLQNGQTEQAKINLDRALKIDESMDGIHASFAYFYQKVGEDQKADESYQEALSQFPDNANTRNNYGAFLCDKQRYKAADKQFLIAINTEANTALANSYENAGLCALRDENWHNAIGHFRKVLGYEKNRARSILGLATSHLKLNQLEAASRFLRSYRQVFAQTAPSLWLAIQIEQKLGNTFLAQKLGQILQSNYPSSAETKLYNSGKA